MMCQFQFINYNKSTTLVSDVEVGKVSHVCRQGGIWERFISSPNFPMKLKLLQKSKLFFFLNSFKSLFYRNKITDIESRLVVDKGEGVMGGLEWEVGVSRYRLLYVEWISSRVLLYGTENYVHIL